jgi:hypothetical protein
MTAVCVGIFFSFLLCPINMHDWFLSMRWTAYVFGIHLFVTNEPSSRLFSFIYQSARDYLISNSCYLFLLFILFVLSLSLYKETPTFTRQLSVPTALSQMMMMMMNIFSSPSTEISMLLLLLYVVFSDIHLFSQRERERD